MASGLWCPYASAYTPGWPFPKHLRARRRKSNVYGLLGGSYDWLVLGPGRTYLRWNLLSQDIHSWWGGSSCFCPWLGTIHYFLIYCLIIFLWRVIANAICIILNSFKQNRDLNSQINFPTRGHQQFWVIGAESNSHLQTIVFSVSCGSAKYLHTFAEWVLGGRASVCVETRWE